MGDEAGGLVNLVKMAGVLVDLVRNPGLPGSEDSAGNTLIPGNGRTARNWLVADRILKDQLFFLRVCEQNRAGFGPTSSSAIRRVVSTSSSRSSD